MRQSIEERMEDSLQDKAKQRFTTPAKFYDPRPQSIKDGEMEMITTFMQYSGFVAQVERMVKDLSNDMELGAAIRQYVNNNAK